MLNVNIKVAPATKGASGTLSKSFRHYLSNILGKNEILKKKKNHICHCTHLGKY